MPGFEGLCEFVYMYGYVKKKKNWKRIGVVMDINFMCAVVGERSLQKLNSTRFLFDRTDFVAKKRTIHFSMHADLG